MEKTYQYEELTGKAKDNARYHTADLFSAFSIVKITGDTSEEDIIRYIKKYNVTYTADGDIYTWSMD